MGLTERLSVDRLVESLRGVLSRGRVAVVLQVGGVVAVSVSAFFVSPLLGGFVSGSAMVLFGVALERD